MPNYVTTRMTATGPDAEIARFVGTCLPPDPETGAPAFDFGSLIPMPELLKATETRPSWTTA